MGILEKHLGTGEIIKIGDEELTLKPLGTEYMGAFFKLAKAFKSLMTDKDKFKTMTASDMIDLFNDDAVSALKELIDGTLKESFPDESESVRKTFGFKYMSLLMEPIMKLNNWEGASHEQVKKQQLIDRIKARQNEQKPTD